MHGSVSRILRLTLLSLTLATVVVSGYLGPRYGKRLPLPGQDTEVSPIVAYSYRPRTTQTDRVQQSRFYPGTRYGSGKRSYLPSLSPSELEPLDPVSYLHDWAYVATPGLKYDGFSSDYQSGDSPDHNKPIKGWAQV